MIITFNNNLNSDLLCYETQHECLLRLETSQSQAKQIKDAVDIQSIYRNTSFVFVWVMVFKVDCLLIFIEPFEFSQSSIYIPWKTLKI